MEYFPPALEKMVEQFARLPGIGHKTAQRLAFFVLSLPENEVGAVCSGDFGGQAVHCPLPRLSRTSRKERGCAPSAPVRNEMAAWSVNGGRSQGCHCHGAGPEYHRTYHVLHGVLSQ